MGRLGTARFLAQVRRPSLVSLFKVSNSSGFQRRETLLETRSLSTGLVPRGGMQ